MNGNQLTKIKNALLFTELAEIRAFEALPDVDIVHSKEYNERVGEIISGDLKARHKTVRTPKRIAVLIIVTALLASLAVTAVAFRKEFKGFFVEVFETFSRFVSKPDDDVPETLEKLYTVSEVPEGFTTVSETANDKVAQTLWLRDMDMLVLEQTVIGMTAGMDTENSECEIIEIDGFEGYKIYKDNTYTLTWSDGEYVFCLVCSDTVSFDKILEMAENLQVKEAVAE